MIMGEPQPEIQRADPRLRARAIVGVLLVCAVIVIAYAVLARWIDQLPDLPRAQARATLARILGWSTGVVCVMVALLGGYAWQLGGKIRRAGRFPLPGTGVIRDTVILTGRRAQTRGRAVRFVGAALVVLSLALAIAAWRLVTLLGGPAV